MKIHVEMMFPAVYVRRLDCAVYAKAYPTVLKQEIVSSDWRNYVLKIFFFYYQFIKSLKIQIQINMFLFKWCYKT